MVNKGLSRLKRLEVYSIVFYMFTYLSAFYNIQETLVTSERVDEYVPYTLWDDYTWLMMWVGGLLTIGLISYGLLRCFKKLQKVAYVILNMVQVVLLAACLCSAYNFIAGIEYTSNSAIAIKSLGTILMLFMVAQLILWICKLVLCIKEHKSIFGLPVEEQKDNPLYVESRKSILKVLMVSLVVTVISFFIWGFPIMFMNSGDFIYLPFIFPFIALIVPFGLFIRNFIGDAIRSHRYIYAIGAIVLYMITINNTYGHIIDRYYFETGDAIQWMSVIMGVINLLICGFAIYRTYRMYKEPIADEQIRAEVEALNGKKARNLVIGLLVGYILCTPICIFEADKDLNHTTLWYSVTYKNTYYYPEYEGEVYEGVEVKVLGFTVYKDIKTKMITMENPSGYNEAEDVDNSYADTSIIIDKTNEFEISKIHFDAIEDDIMIENDEDVAEALNRTINKWKNNYASLEFTFYFYSEETANENWFDSMNYVNIQKLNYPARIVAEVKYESINMEALKELSQRGEISSIHISVPHISESEAE